QHPELLGMEAAIYDMQGDPLAGIAPTMPGWATPTAADIGCSRPTLMLSVPLYQRLPFRVRTWIMELLGSSFNTCRYQVLTGPYGDQLAVFTYLPDRHVVVGETPLSAINGV